jgi:uncharacterized protein (DUF934 family)
MRGPTCQGRMSEGKLDIILGGLFELVDQVRHKGAHLTLQNLLSTNHKIMAVDYPVSSIGDVCVQIGPGKKVWWLHATLPRMMVQLRMPAFHDSREPNET